MITVHDILKTDPYRCAKGDPIYIDKETFYEKGVYVKPSKDLCEKCHRSVKEGNSRIKLFHINGYAGCGKTLLAHYMMYNYGYDDDYYYEFDQGEGKEYSLSYIREMMIHKLGERIGETAFRKREFMVEFADVGKNIYGETLDYKMLHQLIYDDSWLTAAINGDLVCDTLMQFIVTIKDSMRQIADPKIYDINEIIKFLLMCDYLWRCSEVIVKGDYQEGKYVFCLLDNLDNLSRDAVVDLYVDIHDVIRKLTEQRSMIYHYNENRLTHIKCILLFPTREVTHRRLKEGLRRRNQEYLLQMNGAVATFELEGNCPQLDEIIAARKKHWSDKVPNGDHIGKIEIIESLMKIPYVNGQFSELLNGNYSHCVDRIIDLWNEMPEWVAKCAKMQVDREYGADYARCSQEGTRGVLLRMLLELFKERNIYDSVTNRDETDCFNFNGKLGLSELNSESSEGGYSVSISRLLLTFIRSSIDGRVRINHIFKCFACLDGYEICRYLFALSENIRDTWRRLIVFSANIPHNVTDLYSQYERYKSDSSTPTVEFTEVEICLSGRTYIRTVVPNFEFYLSRLNMENGIDVNPPLFSEKSLCNRQGTRVCMHSIEKVLQSIEHCASEIYRYDADMIDGCIRIGELDYIGKLFVESQSYQRAKQSHLSRIIFSHISYIERFRRYLLYITNGESGRDNGFSDEAVYINQQLISFILRYLVLFDKQPLIHGYGELLDNRYLPEHYAEKMTKYNTCKDILAIVESRSEMKQKKTLLDSIEMGYQNQKKAQLKLLDEIRRIHYEGYRIISKVELD